MSWEKYTIYDDDDAPIFKFEAKKVRRMKPVKKKKNKTKVMGFQAPVDAGHLCTCQPHPVKG
jgi:hypothetical protein